MTMLTASQQSLGLSFNVFLQGLESLVQRWGHASGDSERLLLEEKILRTAHQLVLLERFVNMEEASPAKSTSLSGLGGSASSAEKLQKICKALLGDQFNPLLADENTHLPNQELSVTKEKEKLLVYFYRLYYRMLNKDLADFAILH